MSKSHGQYTQQIFGRLLKLKANFVTCVMSSVTYVLLLFRFLGLPQIYFLFSKSRLYFNLLTVHFIHYARCFIYTSYNFYCNTMVVLLLSPLTVQTGTQKICILPQVYKLYLNPCLSSHIVYFQSHILLMFSSFYCL